MNGNQESPPLSPHPLPQPPNGWPPKAGLLRRLLKESSALMVEHHATCAEMERQYNKLWDYTCRLLHDECRQNPEKRMTWSLDALSFRRLSPGAKRRLEKGISEFNEWDGAMADRHEQGYVDGWFFWHTLVPVANVSMDEVEGWRSTLRAMPASKIASAGGDIVFTPFPFLR